jgi:hypothetical protein
MSSLASPSGGVCEVCGIHWVKEPHDHRVFRSLSPERALAYWRSRKDASESG